ncbi:MAG: ArsC family transcriptional regulator [Bdellovibrionaceae bacterium]|nr:ArsC family transcriptional regulator [Pseudobdellovibrionaceae bacterium]
MGKIKVYEYEKCSTCRKALQFLEEKDVDFNRIAIVDKPPTKTELRRMLSYYDGNLKRLFNTSGQVYREMELGKKLPKMSEGEAINLLAANGKLVKRPFVVLKSGGLVGFKEDEWRRAEF